MMVVSSSFFFDKNLAKPDNTHAGLNRDDVQKVLNGLELILSKVQKMTVVQQNNPYKSSSQSALEHAAKQLTACYKHVSIAAALDKEPVSQETRPHFAAKN